MSRPALPILLLNLAGGFALAVTVGLYLLLDKAASITLYPVAVALFCGLALLALLPLLHGRRRGVQVALSLALLCAMLAVQFVNWDSRQPFLRTFNQIETGMTVEQVDALMAGFMRSPAHGGDDMSVGYRHTDEGWGDSDIGLITIVDGRVAAREFLLD